MRRLLRLVCLVGVQYLSVSWVCYSSIIIIAGSSAAALSYGLGTGMRVCVAFSARSAIILF